MLTSITLAILTTWTCYGLGGLLLQKNKTHAPSGTRFFLRYLAGFCTAVLLANSITILSGISHWGFLLALMTPAIANPKCTRELIDDAHKLIPQASTTRWLLVGSIILFVSLHAWTIAHPDTIDYQNDLIKFALDSKHPKNIVAERNQYGYGGAWFPMAALFSFSFALNKIMTFANLSLALVAVFFLVNKIDRHTKSSTATRVCYMLLLAIALWEYTFFRLSVSSAAPDTMAAILALGALFVYSLRERPIWLLPALCCTAVTIKLSTAPVLLLLAFDILLQKKWRMVAAYFLICVLTLTPFTLKNIIGTGYLIYPFAPTKILEEKDVQSKKIVAAEAEYIKAYARLPKPYRDRADIVSVAEAPFPDWLYPWWKSTQPAGKAMIIFALCGILLLLFLGRLRTNRDLRTWGYITTTVAGVLFWLALGPAVRFGSAFLLSPLLLVGSLMGSNESNTSPQQKKIQSLAYSSLILLTAILWAYLIYRMANYMDASALLLPKGPVH